MHVLVVGVGLADVAFETVDGEVHAAKGNGGANFLLTVDGEFGRWILLVRLDESGTLHEHAAGTGGWIKHAPVEGLDDLDDESDDRSSG